MQSTGVCDAHVTRNQGRLTMNFHNIEYFLAMVENSSISKAAQSLHISQQSLSEQLKKLEEEVGAPLIKRGRPLQLTAAGQIFLRTSAKLLGIYNKTLDEIAALSEKRRARITLAVPTTDTPPFLAGLLTAFSAEHPEFEVKVVPCRPKDAAKQAENFDLYFSTLPLASELENVPILEGGTYAVAFSSDLARRVYGKRWPKVEAQLLEKRDIRTLQDMPFIILLSRMDDVVLDQQIIFKKAGFEPNISFQSENSELNSDMCIAGIGVYVATMDSCRRRFSDRLGGNGGILIYPIDTDINPVMIALAHRKGMQLTKAAACFIESAKKYLRNNRELLTEQQETGGTSASAVSI